MVLRQEFAKQILIRLQEDNIYAKKDNFTCNQNKMAKTHSRSNRIIHGQIYVIHKK